MSEGEERLDVDLLVIPVADVYILTVEDTACLGTEVEIRRIIL
jgi:hypothetical protein